MIIVSQIRINVLNSYSGSLAFSMCLARLFNLKPGRPVALIILAVLGTLLMSVNLLDHLTAAFSFISIFLTAWVLAVVSYIIFNRSFCKVVNGVLPYQQGEIENYNPVGLSAIIIALIISVPLGLGWFGLEGKTYAPFVAGLLSFMLVPIVMAIRKK